MVKSLNTKYFKLLPKELRALKFHSRTKRSCHICGKDYDSKTRYDIYCDLCLEESEYFQNTDKA